jgi:hypothetical protein
MIDAMLHILEKYSGDKPAKNGKGEVKGWNWAGNVRVLTCIIVALIFFIWMVCSSGITECPAPYRDWAQDNLMPVPNHRERQLMQLLRGAGWVKAIALPSSPRVGAGLLSKGWIERRGDGNDTFYRITDKGLAAKSAPARI